MDQPVRHQRKHSFLALNQLVPNTQCARYQADDHPLVLGADSFVLAVLVRLNHEILDYSVCILPAAYQKKHLLSVVVVPRVEVGQVHLYKTKMRHLPLPNAPQIHVEVEQENFWLFLVLVRHLVLVEVKELVVVQEEIVEEL